jgi:HD-like signal output (HDOD) protein
MTTQTSLKDISKKIQELPTPDFLVQNIIAVASDPESNTKDLNNAVIKSPPLSAKILKMSNSAYYALPRRVTKLTQAINILGFKTVRNLALSIFTVKSYFRKEYEFFNTEKFWKHLMGTAIASELLSKHLNYPEREEAFLCGMLHDMGKIAMSIIMPDIFEMIIKVSRHKKISFEEAEELLETYSHQQIGKILFESWNLSDVVIDSANFHNSPQKNKNENTRMLTNIVYISNLTINIIFYGFSGSFSIPVPNEDIWNSVGLTPKKYLSYFEKLKIVISESEDFLNINNIVEDMEEE